MTGFTIRALQIRVKADHAVFGRDLNFTSGLNILRADNTSGKTTALMSILFALGLEGMLGPTWKVPLAHAMTDRIEHEGAEFSVHESFVRLELSNAAGQTICVTRYARSQDRDINLIAVSLGPELTLGREYQRRDFFVRRQGAAQREAGFHKYLAQFMALDLPDVTRTDGSEGPLYLETLFPFFFVEQKHGWSSTQARVPTHFRIKEVQRRSAEFVLGLDVLERIRQRQRLRSNMAEIEGQWSALKRHVAERAHATNLGLARPVGRISSGIAEYDFIPKVTIGDEWVTLQEAPIRLRATLAAESDRVRTVGEAASEIEVRAQTLESKLRQALAVAASISEERQLYEGQVAQLEVRIEALREDLQRHKDSEILRNLGSRHAHSLLVDRLCPTCHQEVEDGLSISRHPMTTSENIEFIGRQIATFESMRADTVRVITAIQAREASVRREAQDTRREIRATRDALVSANSLPSVDDVARRYSLAARADELERVSGEFDDFRREFQELARNWDRQRSLLDELGNAELSVNDTLKLDALSASVRNQLVLYGFSSLRPQEIAIDEATYRPTHDGFDLGFDISASDMIRVIWAYLIGMLNISRQYGGNHIGVLVFDEPRQQDTAVTSYRELLSQAVASGEAGSQVIFATSEPLPSLMGLLGGAPCNLVSLLPGEKLLQRLS